MSTDPIKYRKDLRKEMDIEKEKQNNESIENHDQ